MSLKQKTFLPIASIKILYLAEIQKRFNAVGNIKNYFIIVKNPWHIENDDVKLFSQFGFPKTQLMKEIIELKYDTQLKAHFIEHREKQEYIEFSRNMPKNYKCLRDRAQFILTIFPSIYLYELHFLKMSLKNKCRNRLSTYSHDAIRITCSPKDADIEEIIKKVHHNT